MLSNKKMRFERVTVLPTLFESIYNRLASCQVGSPASHSSASSEGVDNTIPIITARRHAPLILTTLSAHCGCYFFAGENCYRVYCRMLEVRNEKMVPRALRLVVMVDYRRAPKLFQEITPCMMYQETFNIIIRYEPQKLNKSRYSHLSTKNDESYSVGLGGSVAMLLCGYSEGHARG